ncbi:hypothetical protein ANN_10531 [Periplaneta americana]|uniref:Uncharacterized protein n=1 Tax=Periplaneta americana TaxID=6978 RepID=A0ABQ8TT54_PERAM|nr:hypothetical protein ANN_10531 [Periplaneta americana]
MYLREVGYDDRDWINLAQDRAYVFQPMTTQVTTVQPMTGQLSTVIKPQVSIILGYAIERELAKSHGGWKSNTVAEGSYGLASLSSTSLLAYPHAPSGRGPTELSLWRLISPLELCGHKGKVEMVSGEVPQMNSNTYAHSEGRLQRQGALQAILKQKPDDFKALTTSVASVGIHSNLGRPSRSYVAFIWRCTVPRSNIRLNMAELPTAIAQLHSSSFGKVSCSSFQLLQPLAQDASRRNGAMLTKKTAASEENLPPKNPVELFGTQ